MMWERNGADSMDVDGNYPVRSRPCEKSRWRSGRRRHTLRIYWHWLWGGRRWFRLGWCTWCHEFEMIVPGEALCEACWLDSK
jgi:hypothetical protein